MATEILRAGFNPVFRPVNACRLRYRVLKGSAGSGKSVNVAQDYILKLSDARYRGANLLCVRKIEESNRDSTFAELRSAVLRIFGDRADSIWRVRTNPLSLYCIPTGNAVLFRGMLDDRQREKIKSITFPNGKLCWIWCEEATELAAADVDILDDRLRGLLPEELYYQITLTFNPISAAHWIKGRYFDCPRPDTLTHHSTYLDNRFLDASFHDRMERRRVEDPEGYRIYGLGEWGETAGLILTNYCIEDFDRNPARWDARYFGQDFGYNHYNALLDVGFRDGELFICRELYIREKDTGEIIGLANREKWDRSVEMFCDSAEPDRIKTWRTSGYRAFPVVKEPGSVLAQIDFLKRLRIHIHPSCVGTIREIQMWKWKRDAKTGAWLDEPDPHDDDAMAALRYAVERARKGAHISVLR